MADQTEGIGGRGRHGGRTADDVGTADIDAELLGNGALHFRDPHLQHHLIGGADGQNIDHLLGIAGEAGGEIDRALCLLRRSDMTGQHHGVVDRLRLDVGIGEAELDQLGQIGGVFFNPDVDRGDLLAVGVEEEGVGLAALLRHQENAPRGANDGIDDRRIGHQHVARIGIDFDQRGLAEPEGDALMHRQRGTPGRDRDLPCRGFFARRGSCKGGIRRDQARGERQKRNQDLTHYCGPPLLPPWRIMP